MKQFFPAAAMTLIVCAAQAQTYRDSGGTVVPGLVPIQPGIGPLFTPSNPGNVAGTFSASLSGFTPTSSYKQLTSGGTSSVSTAVPTGAVDVVYNTSASVAYCTYGSSGVAATSSSDVIQASSWVAFTVPSGATTIACISPSGNLSINVSGGSGLPTGAGGGGGGGSGSNASVGSTGSSPPSSGTYLGMNVGGSLTGVTGTANGLKVDGSSVTQPVSAASLPLPSGAATAANQPALNGDGGALAHVTNFPTTQAVNNPVGAGTIVTSQNSSIANTATLLLSALTGAPGTGRVCVNFTQASTVPVYIGPSTVTTSGPTGGDLIPGTIGYPKTICTTAALYGIVSGGTNGYLTWNYTY
jgi:hypothetical protein